MPDVFLHKTCGKSWRALFPVSVYRSYFIWRLLPSSFFCRICLFANQLVCGSRRKIRGRKKSSASLFNILHRSRSSALFQAVRFAGFPMDSDWISSFFKQAVRLNGLVQSSLTILKKKKLILENRKGLFLSSCWVTIAFCSS